MPQAPGNSRLGKRLRRAVGGSVLISLLGSAAGFAAGSVELVSRIAPSQVSGTGAGARNGLGPEAFSQRPTSLSDDGRYALFSSFETNLVPGQRDANQAPDVFLQDLLTGTTALVSHALGAPATAGNDRSDEAAISGDGRWVAFTSQATDLAPGQPPLPPGSGRKAILLYDRAADASTLIADSSFASFQLPTVSGDGRWVAFASNAMDLVPGQQGVSALNVFLYDQAAKTFQLVSHASASPAASGSGPSTRPALSADGRFVAFVSSATDLVPGQPAGDAVFLYDRTSGAVARVGPGQEVAMSADGRFLAVHGLQSTYLYDRATQVKTPLATTNPANSALVPRSLAITPDGRYVALVSLAGSVVPPQPGNPFAQGVYLYDRISGTFTLASRKHGSATTPGASGASPTISADGRLVAFLSQDPDLVTGQADTNGDWDVFLFDRASGAVTLASRAVASATTAADGLSYAPAIGADGAHVVFSSLADNLAAGVADRNQGEDVFVYATASASLAAVSRHAPDLPSIAPEGFTLTSAVSGDGRWVAFESDAPRLIDGQVDTNDRRDVFLYDRAARATILVSHAAGSLTHTAHGGSFAPRITPDGRWVLFVSDATDLVAGTALGTEAKYFLYDRLAGTTVLAGGTRSQGANDEPFLQASLTPDGRWVAFVSNAPDLVPGQRDPGTNFDIFLWDRVTGVTTLVDHSTAGPAVTGPFDALQPRISADGRWVAFLSGAPNLVPGQVDVGIGPSLFLWDRTTGRTVLASHAQGSPLTPTGVDPFAPFSISADGRFLAFQSLIGIEPGAPPGGLYLFDRTSPALVRIAANGLIPMISADGHYVAFLSVDVPGVDTRGQAQVFLYDRIAQTTTLVSRSLSGNARGGDDDASEPSISADGRYVAFVSQATDVAPGLPASGPFGSFPSSSVFLWDRLAGTTAWISAPRPDSSIQAASSDLPVLSASGRQVAFTSGLDLVAGDFNSDFDVYLFSLDPPPTPTGGPVTVPPCALFSGVLRSNARKVLKVAGACGVPAGVKQVAVRLTVSQGTGKGNVQLYPGNVRTPSAGILRFERGATRSAGFTLPLSTNGTGTIALLPFVGGNGTVRVSVEIDGYTP